MTAKADTASVDFEALKSFFTETLEQQMAPLREEINTLKTKVSEVDRQVPKFVPMQQRANPSGMPRTPQEHLALITSAEGREGTAKSVMTTINGRPMDQGALKAFMDSFQPEFQQGETVRINPEAVRLGWPEGKTWGQLLAKGRTNPDGYGVVREIEKFSHRGWMYRVHVKEHSPERGMVFDQHELLHA